MSTGAERYMRGQLEDPEYRRAYLRERARIVAEGLQDEPLSGIADAVSEVWEVEVDRLEENLRIEKQAAEIITTDP